MKTARYSDAQIMGILKQAEGGVPVSELCREHGDEQRLILQMAGAVWWHALHGRLIRRIDREWTLH